MTVDVNAMADAGQARRVRSGAGWEEPMAASGRRDGPQASFRQGRGVPVRTSRSWRRRRGLTGGAASGADRGPVHPDDGAPGTGRHRAPQWHSDSDSCRSDNRRPRASGESRKPGPFPVLPGVSGGSAPGPSVAWPLRLPYVASSGPPALDAA